MTSDLGSNRSPETAPMAPRADLVALARALPANVKFGTATWACDGWAGDVYQRSYLGPQPRRRLEEYVRYPLFATVGINSAFYDRPSEDVLAAYARVLPRGYPCIIKVWDRITARRFIRDPRWGALAGQPNPDFLSPALFADAVLAPYTRIFRYHTPYFVFEFQAMRGRDLPRPEAWAEELDHFFSQIPHDVRYAVELRNPQLLGPDHGAVLAHHRLAHVFNSWTDMPPIGAQLDFSWAFSAPFTIARALLKPGRKYAEAVRAFEPYDRVREPLPELRADLLRLMDEATTRGIQALIHVNNRAEGNAPGTIRAIAEAWQAARG